jgi:hypothetical protein
MAMAFTKPTVKLGLPRLGSGNNRHTDKMELLSTGILVGFKGRPAGVDYPTPAMRASIQAAGVQARSIVRIANDEMAKVMFLRRAESALLTNTMTTHFNMAPGNLGGVLKDNVVDKKLSAKAVFVKDRRWVLEKVRQNFLSLSFHLNTGMYLIDMDTATRTVEDGAVIPVGTATVADGYVFPRAGGTCTCGFANGEIHIDFNDVPNYSLNSVARLIIHEAAHKYLNVDDRCYAKDAGYPPSLMDCLDNADSIAWAAVSLATGAVRMTTTGSNDWNNCPGGAV